VTGGRLLSREATPCVLRKIKTAIEIEEKIAARHFNKESGTEVRISSGAPFGYREGLAGVCGFKQDSRSHAASL